MSNNVRVSVSCDIEKGQTVRDVIHTLMYDVPEDCKDFSLTFVAGRLDKDGYMSSTLVFEGVE